MKAVKELTDAEIHDAMAANPSYGRRWEPKACKTCEHVRRVLVYFVTKYGVERDHRWEPFCRACQADQRARHYEHEARRFREMASELRARQQMSTMRRYKKSAGG
jgi:hypothetical protein